MNEDRFAVVPVAHGLGIRRRLPMWEIRDTSIVHWVSTWQEQRTSWADARRRRGFSAPGRVQVLAVQGRERRMYSLPPDAVGDLAAELTSDGWRCTILRTVPQR